MRAEQAIAYAERGWPIFPLHHIMPDGRCSCRHDCSSPGKHPLTRHGLKEASTDPKMAEVWWGRYPDANIGLATGRVYVIDLDGLEGLNNWDLLELRHSPAPTLTARTGGGGIHRYYRMPDDVELGNTAGRLAPNIDTRGYGGYVLAPDSNHKSGRSYAWVSQIEIAALARWVVNLIKPKLPPQPKAPPTFNPEGHTAYGIGILNGALSRISLAPEGQRNETLTRESFILAQYVSGGEVDGHNLEALLLAAAPDPDKGKSADTIRRALIEGSQYPRRKRDD